MSEHWIAARTKPKAEHLAAMNLTNQGYAAYVPLVAVDGIIAPLLPGYIFVDVEPRQGLWRPIENTRGCGKILMTGERPSLVPTKDIEALREREDAGAIRIRTIMPETELEKGQMVKIISGAFEGFDAIFERKSGAERVALWISYMGALRFVTTERREVA